MKMTGTIYGHDLKMVRGTKRDEYLLQLVPRWWSPLPLALAAAGMVRWPWRPLMFLFALWHFGLWRIR